MMMIVDSSVAQGSLHVFHSTIIVYSMACEIYESVYVCWSPSTIHISMAHSPRTHDKHKTTAQPTEITIIAHNRFIMKKMVEPQ